MRANVVEIKIDLQGRAAAATKNFWNLISTQNTRKLLFFKTGFIKLPIYLRRRRRWSTRPHKIFIWNWSPSVWFIDMDSSGQKWVGSCAGETGQSFSQGL